MASCGSKNREVDIKKSTDINKNRLKERLCEKFEWTQLFAHSAVLDYLRMLWVYGHNKDKKFKTPTSIITVWKEHLLDPVEYSRYCLYNFGFVVSFPFQNVSSSDQEDFEYPDSYFESLFGCPIRNPFNKDVWGEIEPPNKKRRSNRLNSQNPANVVVQLFIKDLQSKTLTIFMKLSSTVEQLNNQIQIKSGVEPIDQRLIYCGRQLYYNEGQTLLDWGIRPEATIHLVLRLGGC
jgi:hypothetical protein